MKTDRSLLSISRSIDCRHLTAGVRTADGWVLSCKLDKKAANEERCKLCRRKEAYNAT